MASEQLIAELTALREKHTLDEVLELVMVGLGGKEKVAAELEEYDEDETQDDGAGEAETPDLLTVMRDADVGRMENIQFMAESFCTWLHAKGAQQMEKDTDEAVDMVRQLSTSFNKAARAVRLSMVLKHEVAGLRPLPSARAPTAANENGAAGSAARPGSRHRHFGERAGSNERREETDAERRERLEDERSIYLLALLDAFEEDAANASPEIQAEVEHQSPVVNLTTVAASIPHPKLDRRIADIHLGRLWDAVAPRNATKPEALAPPTWDTVSRRRANDENHRRWRAEKAARRR